MIPARAESACISRVSGLEVDILDLWAKGLNTQEITDDLNLALREIEEDGPEIAEADVHAVIVEDRAKRLGRPQQS